MIQKRIKRTSCHGTVLVAATVVDKQSPIDHGCPAWKTDSSIKTLDLVIRLGFHQPMRCAMQNATGIFEVQQQRAKSIVPVLTDCVVEREPTMWSANRWRIDAQFVDFPRVLVLDQQATGSLREAQQVVRQRDPGTGLLRTIVRSHPFQWAMNEGEFPSDAFRKQDRVAVIE